MLDPAARAAAKARAEGEDGEEEGPLGMDGPSRLVRELQVRHRPSSVVPVVLIGRFFVLFCVWAGRVVSCHFPPLFPNMYTYIHMNPTRTWHTAWTRSWRARGCGSSRGASS